MDDRLAAVFAAQGGVASSADAARLGIRAVQLDALVRSHQLVRVRRGAYVLKETHDGADVWERYRLRTRAILRTRPAVDAASHHAALMLHAVDTYDVDLSVVDVVARVKATRVRSGLRTHPGRGLVADRAPGFNVVGLPVALCQVAGGSGCSPPSARWMTHSTTGAALVASWRMPSSSFRSTTTTAPGAPSTSRTRRASRSGRRARG